MHPNQIIDNLLDELGRWRTQAKNWETLCHELADALRTNDKTQEALTLYTRTVRKKYKSPRLK